MSKALNGAATSAAAAANEFLAFSRTEPNVPAVDQMKLQKLLFYAHAWHLAMFDQPLFEEDFEAWPWGPVVRDVYAQTRSYGRAPVSGQIVRVQSSPDLHFRVASPRVEDERTRAFLRSVWDSHKNFTGIQLSNSTHAPGEPWTVVKEQLGSLDSKPAIPNELIRDIYKAKMASTARAA